MGTEPSQSPDLIRAQLKRLLASKLFRASELQKQFLSFVILRTLEGRSTEIKEYVIGAEAFGRGADFDPRIDSVVRVVARRVRERLAEYYRHEGKDDGLLIQLSAGSYIPSFSTRKPADVSQSASPSVSPSPGAAEELVGATISHYEILELIGSGGSGLVYRAEDLRLNRGVAFKVLFPQFASDAQQMDGLMREARSASAVNHPNICAIYDLGEFQGRAYIVMELVEGKTLDLFIGGKPLAIDTLLNLGVQVSGAVTAAHSGGIVHHDVRSSNIVVNAQVHAKLLDFSAARATRQHDARRATAATAATPGASPSGTTPSPETAYGTEPAAASSTLERADIIGMGALLYEMATGRQYEKGSDRSPRKLNPSVPAGLDRLIQAAIGADPALGGVARIREALVGLQYARDQGSPPAGGLRFRRVLSSGPIRLAVLGSAVLLFGLYFFARRPPPPKILSYKQLTHDAQGKLGGLAFGVPAPLVSGDARLYFNEVSGSQVLVKEVSTSGGETVPLRTDMKRPLVVMDLSPDRSELLASDFFHDSPDRQLFKLSLPGGATHPVASLTGHDAAWSPDGERICYVNGNSLYVANRDGADSRLIASLPGLPSWPRWSPDGKLFRLTVQDANGGTSLWEVSLAGYPPHPLLPGWSDHPTECCGSWSRDGKYFVFQSTRQGSTSLWVIREKHLPFRVFRDAPARLTEGPLNVWAPEFSPDGHRIFAVVQQKRGELVRYDSTQKSFGLFLGGISADHVEFSRDSQWIAYCPFPEGTIWRSRPDGSERMQLSFAPINAIFPRWSPDGSRIAFMGSLPGKAVTIYIVSSNGSTPELLSPETTPLIDPNWSPDGGSIMFAKLPSVNDMSSEKPLIQILDLKSHNLSTLPGSEGLTAPRWSPDGRYVVATALSQGKWSNPAVVIFDFTTGKWTGLESDPIDNKWWSADGKYFYFDKYLDNDVSIYRLRLSDRSIERIASLKDVRRSFGDMGWWMGVTPDGAPMVLRDTSIEEIYALDFSDR